MKKYYELSKKINNDAGMYRCFIAYTLGETFNHENFATDKIVEFLYKLWLDNANKFDDILFVTYTLIEYAKEKHIFDGEKLFEAMQTENFLQDFTRLYL